MKSGSNYLQMGTSNCRFHNMYLLIAEFWTTLDPPELKKISFILKNDEWTLDKKISILGYLLLQLLSINAISFPMVFFFWGGEGVDVQSKVMSLVKYVIYKIKVGSELLFVLAGGGGVKCSVKGYMCR